MSGQEDTTEGASQVARAPEPDSRVSRRSVLRGAATAGIAATALTAASPPALAAVRPAQASRTASGADESQADEPQADPGEPIVAHLRDARSGEIDVFRGTSSTRLRDPALAALLLRASQ